MINLKFVINLMVFNLKFAILTYLFIITLKVIINIIYTKIIFLKALQVIFVNM